MIASMHGHSIQIEIDGETFKSLTSAFAIAKERGFKGCKGTFDNYLKAGRETWAELLRPVSVVHASLGRRAKDVKASRRAREKAEMLALCAELDARKAALR